MRSKHTDAARAGDSFSQKQERILDAAKICFVRSGFDRTTMQDIAREAKMSSPNIYRYFTSKESLVLGLAERDGKRNAFIAEPLARPDGGSEAMIEVFQRYFSTLDRDSAILSLDLWLNATRHPALAEIEEQGQNQARAWLRQTLLDLAKSPHCDPDVIIEAIDPILKGMVVSRALIPGYDHSSALAQVRTLVREGLLGKLIAAVPER